MKYSWIIICIVSLFFYAPSFGNETSDYIQFLDHGSINWTRGILQAKGMGTLPKNNHIKNDAHPLAQKKATETARQKMLKIIYQVRIDAGTSVEEIALSNEALNGRLKAMVKKAQVVKQEYLSDGTVEVTLEMPLYGGFAQMLLPKEITQLSSIRPVVEKKAKKKALPEPEASDGKQDCIAHTGLVVNAKGLEVVPAMAPKVFDERGEQVYGAAFVSREFAVQEGMCGYSSDLRSASENERVADKPLVVKGLRTDGPALTDIVISNADASRIRSSSDNLAFMRKCRVMIVLN